MTKVNQPIADPVSSQATKPDSTSAKAVTIPVAAQTAPVSNHYYGNNVDSNGNTNWTAIMIAVLGIFGLAFVLLAFVPLYMRSNCGSKQGCVDKVTWQPTSTKKHQNGKRKTKKVTAVVVSPTKPQTSKIETTPVAEQPNQKCSSCAETNPPPTPSNIVDDPGMGRPRQIVQPTVPVGPSQAEIEAEIEQARIDAYEQGVKDRDAIAQAEAQDQVKTRKTSTAIRILGGIAQTAINRRGRYDGYQRRDRRYIPDGRGGYIDKRYPLGYVINNNCNLLPNGCRY